MENKNNDSFNVLSNEDLLAISAGSVASCTWATVKEHYIKTFLFGMIYVIGVAVGCDS